MARIRTIKPEFFTSSDIVNLSFPARLLYIALWCEADREGRLKLCSATIKNRYFAADEVDVKALIKELLTQGLVVSYEVDGKWYGEIPSFLEHQSINPRESASKLPKLSTISRVTDASNLDLHAQRGRERKGKEGKGREYAPSEEVTQWAVDKKITRFDERLEVFRLRAASKGYDFDDWDAAFMRSCLENWAGFDAPKENVIPLETKGWICEVCDGPASRKEGNAYYCANHSKVSFIENLMAREG